MGGTPKTALPPQDRAASLESFVPPRIGQGCFILAKNRWGDGEMGRWGEFWTNTRDFGQIYRSLTPRPL
ncbi:hypothetical protein, partial [Moorena sp. SIO3I6]|uniref:hypothetical protein n=1 Tax=Moorena sp. SIO3I6 TaxID=2607831 RepID=UPI0013FB49CB